MFSISKIVYNNFIKFARDQKYRANRVDIASVKGQPSTDIVKLGYIISTFRCFSRGEYSPHLNISLQLAFANKSAVLFPTICPLLFQIIYIFEILIYWLNRFLNLPIA